jgi:hypothetical protein
VQNNYKRHFKYIYTAAINRYHYFERFYSSSLKESLSSAMVLPMAFSVKRQWLKELHTQRLLSWNCTRRGKMSEAKVFSDISNTVMTLSNTIK